MKTALDTAERHFLEQLHRLQAGTVQELGEALGVTATAVRQRLGRLQNSGLVAREVERSGRGRPHHRYRVTEKGRRYLGDNSSDLTLILWRAMSKFPDSAVREQLQDRIREALAARFSDAGDEAGIHERLHHLQSQLVERGYSVDVDLEGQLPILRENNCPFYELAEENSEICEMERQVFEQVLGSPLRLTSCCRNSDRCCEFEVQV